MAASLELGHFSFHSLRETVIPYFPLGGYNQSGIGRENHLKMTDHRQQTKHMLVSYSLEALGVF